MFQSKFCFSFLLVVFYVFASSYAFAESNYLSIGTGGTGGTFYPTGGAVAELISDECESIKEATAEVTAASLENAKLVQAKQADMGMASWIAIVTAGMEDELPDVRTMWQIHGSPRHFIVEADSDIKSINDFKGKRVVVGSPGSATYEASEAVLEIFGISFDDIKDEPLSFSDGCEALKDGRVDVATVQAGYPNSAVTNLATTHDVRILSFKESDLKKIEKAYPSLPPVTIPKGTYPGQEKDIQTFNTPGPWICHKDLPEEVVYEIVKVVHKKQDWLTENIHKAVQFWEFSPSVKKYAPLHPGAKKYYEEIGLVKNE